METTFFQRYFSAALFSLLLLVSIADILIDVGNGESISHFGLEGFSLLLLALACWYFGKKSVMSNAGQAVSSSGWSWRLLFFVSFLSFCALISDDFIEFISEFDDTSDYVSKAVFAHNLHEVVPGKFYRSGEMSHKALRGLIDDKGIKTVIDLRLGDDEPDSEGLTEADSLKDLPVRYEHIKFSSLGLPALERVTALLDVYKTAELPILVHCSDGTHRSGFASAVWMLEHEGGTKEQALEQLSPRYGFFKFERRIKSYQEGREPLNSLIWRYAEVTDPTESFSAWVTKVLSQPTEPPR